MFAFKFEIIFWQPISVWREAIRFNKCEHLDPNRFRYGDRNCRPVINKLHRLTYIRGIQMSSKLCYVVLIRVIYTVFLVEARLQRTEFLEMLVEWSGKTQHQLLNQPHVKESTFNQFISVAKAIFKANFNHCFSFFTGLTMMLEQMYWLFSMK